MNKNRANACIWNTGLLILSFADFSFILEKSFFKKVCNLPRIALYVWTLLMLLQCPPVVGTGLIFAYDKS